MKTSTENRSYDPDPDLSPCPFCGKLTWGAGFPAIKPEWWHMTSCHPCYQKFKADPLAAAVAVEELKRRLK